MESLITETRNAFLHWADVPRGLASLRRLRVEFDVDLLDARLDFGQGSYKTLLQAACKQGLGASAVALLEAGADFFRMVSSSAAMTSALDYCCVYGQLDAVQQVAKWLADHAEVRAQMTMDRQRRCLSTCLVGAMTESRRESGSWEEPQDFAGCWTELLSLGFGASIMWTARSSRRRSG